MRNAIFVLLLIPLTAYAVRARDLGLIPGNLPPGKNNAITDVPGVLVGQVTLKEGKGKHAVRTGVTVVMPSEDGGWERKFPAGQFALNGNGEAMGLMWVNESGILETPIGLTNTLSVSDVQRGILQWVLKKHPKIGTSDDTLTPVVMECDDSALNDIRGFHVKREHAIQAIESAKSGPVAEGGVGAGTGMMTYQFKGGIGSSSRLVDIDGKRYTLGLLLNANHGKRDQLRLLGTPVGKLLQAPLPKLAQEGSIVIVIATDAPLDGRQLSRLTKRAFLGIARTGAIASHGSGDVGLAFSTGNRIPHYPAKALLKLDALSDFFINPLFEAAADAAEEALYNAMISGTTTEGRAGNTVYALPQQDLGTLIKKVN